MTKFWQFNVKDAVEEMPAESELFLSGPIAEESWFGDEMTPKLFGDELKACKGDITVHINSPGGDCVAASLIYTMLMDYEGNVNVQIDGIAASAASVIAMAGAKVTMSPTSMLMIHDPLTMAYGNKSDLKEAIRILDEFKESIINAYEIKTGLSRDKIAALMQDEGTWMNAKKALELGFCDEILFTGADAAPENAVSYSHSVVTNSLMGKIAAAREPEVADDGISEHCEDADHCEAKAEQKEMISSRLAMRKLYDALIENEI